MCIKIAGYQLKGYVTHYIGTDSVLNISFTIIYNFLMKILGNIYVGIQVLYNTLLS